MSLESDIALLLRVPLFASLPAEQLRLIAFSAVRLELTPGHVLFRKGTVAKGGYIVSEGRIELAETDDGGKRSVVAVCEPGTLIGEIALFIETKRPATATATEASQVIEIDRKVIMRMLDEYPQLAVRLRATLNDRLSATVTELHRVRQALINVDRIEQSRR
jgi:CRP-like cAMP-binding protein